MKIKSWKLKEDKISEEAIEEISKTFCSTLRIGIEIEGHYGGESLNDVHDNISNTLNCKIGKSEIQVEDLSNDFLYVYNDGSINTEVVTGALKLNNLRNIYSRAIETMEDLNIRISPRYGAGGHQNISSATMMPGIVGRNIRQLLRYYLPALCKIACVKETVYREYSYRDYPPCGWRKYVENEKYCAMFCKSKFSINQFGEGLYEFRYPDAMININQVYISTIINAAIVLKAVKLSQNGVAMISKKDKEQSKNLYEKITTEIDISSILPEMINRFNEMVRYLIDEIDQICKASFEKKIDLPFVEEQLAKVSLMENGSDLNLGEF